MRSICTVLVLLLALTASAQCQETERECTNPFFPVVYMATYDYLVESSTMDEYSYTTQIGPVGTDIFTQGIEYSTGVTASHEWSCYSGNLTQLDASNGLAGTLFTLGGAYSSLETEDIYGVTIPFSISEGETWTNGMNVKGEMMLPNGNSGSAEGEYSAVYKAVGYEDIDVPAGSFRAMRINVSMLYDMVVTVDEMDFPIPITASMILWYAEGVGLVKAESMNEFSGYEIIELWRYSIP